MYTLIYCMQFYLLWGPALFTWIWDIKFRNNNFLNLNKLTIYMKHMNHFWGGVMGLQILQNRSEIRITTTQNNIRKPPMALKLPKNFWIPQTAWFCKIARPQLTAVNKKFHKTAPKVEENRITTNPCAPPHIFFNPGLSIRAGSRPKPPAS